MSKQQSKKAQLQRFSGPELAELLELVAQEHGSSAAIAAVNRVRSGGVAGFFCREEFEVIVDLRGTARRAKAAKAGPSARPNAGGAKKAATTKAAGTPRKTAASAGSKSAPSSNPGQSRPAGRHDGRSPADPPPVVPTIDLASAEPTPQTSLIQPPTPPGNDLGPDVGEDPALDFFADDADDPEDVQTPAAGPEQAHEAEVSIDLSDRATGEEPTPGVFGGPRPEALDGTHAGFLALLQQRLDEAPPDDPPLAARRPSKAKAEEAGPPSVDEVSQPVVPAPAITALTKPVSESFSLLNPEPTGFWRKLQETEAELASFMPVSSAIVAAIGPLSLTTPIARRLQSQPGLESADVVVLTGRTEIVSEPGWELVRSGSQLVDEAESRRDKPTILVIDVPVTMPGWVAPLQRRLRAAGVGLFRYAVPGEPTAEKLNEYRLASDVPYVLDLASRVPPRNLVEFIAQRHPIASVSGAELTAELLLAIRKQVGVGL